MSLRAFHIAFIVVSITLTVVVCAWGVREYLGHADTGALTIACLSALTGVALVIYGTRFFKKLQELG